MSTGRITGTSGIIMESSGYLELPKGSTLNRPSSPREGMIRYNYATKTYEIVVNPYGTILDSTPDLEWRGIAYLDSNGKISSTTLPSSVLGSMVYKGTWDASINDINVTANESNVVLTPLPAPTIIGNYYIVRTEGSGSTAANLALNQAPYKVGDYIVANGSKWEKIDNSSISTTASSVSFSDALVSDRGVLAVGSTTVQTALEAITLRALDRTGDIITGDINFSNSANIIATYQSTPFIHLSGYNTSGIMFDASGNTIITSGGVEVANFSSSYLKSKNLVLDSGGFISIKNFLGTKITLTETSTNFTYNNVSGALINATGITTPSVKSSLITSSDGGTQLVFNTNNIEILVGGEVVGAFTSAGQQSSNSIAFSSGTLSLPGISFTGRSDVGLYSSADHSVSIVANGVESLIATDTYVRIKNKLLTQTSTASAPSLAFSTDQTSGLYQDVNGTVSISANGTNVITFSSDGISLNKPLSFGSGTVASPGVVFGTNGFYTDLNGYVGISINKLTTPIIFGSTDIKSYVPILAVSGTSTIPSYSFKDYTTSGMFTTTGNVEFVTNGVKIADLTSSNAVLYKPINRDIDTQPIITSLSAAGYITVSNSGTTIHSAVGAEMTLDTNIKCRTDVDISDQTLILDNTTSSSISYDSDTNVIQFKNSNNEIVNISSTSMNAIKPILVSDGMISAPSIGFSTAPTSGLYLSNSLNVGITVNNTISSTFTNTGIYIPSTNSIVFDGGDISQQSSISSIETGTKLLFSSVAIEKAFQFGENSTNVFFSINSDSIAIPKGNSINSTITPESGFLRYNDLTNTLEVFTTEWVDIINTSINASDLGSGIGITGPKNGSSLQFKTLVNGSNISISSDANTITIDSTLVETPELNINSSDTDYILSQSDRYRCVEMAVDIANTVTIPLNSDVSLPIGTYIMIRQMGVGQTTIVAASGVTILNPHGTLNLKSRYASCWIHKTADDTWCIEGNLAES